MMCLAEPCRGDFRGSQVCRLTGFTLVELLSVLVVVGLLTGMVSWRLHGSLQRVRLRQSLERIEGLDRQARAEARRSSRTVRLEIDPTDGRLLLDKGEPSPGGRSRRSTKGVSVVLPSDVGIREVKVAARGTVRRDVVLAVSPLGQSLSYAVELATARAGNGWVVVLGRTGQIVRLQSEGEVDALLAD
jgi:prepilin-type N-terminal cleavage/methylation domain-containing protein